ncbi:MAG: type I-F CRISPR-associated endoribonuclease Cas6/Csy4 [Pseudolabrys sp.]
MKRYLDITVTPDPEFSTPLLLSALFGKLHRALVALSTDAIGISFPHYQARGRNLGDVLRLHDDGAELDRLLALDWLQGMRDHISASSIQSVPEGVRYRNVRRRQFKTNVERLRRRRAARHGETLEQARERIPDSIERRVTLPYLTLRSQSTRQSFCLFIEHGPLKAQPTPGAFNSYGLSDTATVPWF